MQNLIFIAAVTLIGFIFPWWSVFIISFLCGALKLIRAPHVLACVLLSYTSMILYFGDSLLRVLNFGIIVNTNATSGAVAFLIAGVFALTCGLCSSIGRDINHILLRR